MDEYIVIYGVTKRYSIPLRTTTIGDVKLMVLTDDYSLMVSHVIVYINGIEEFDDTIMLRRRAKYDKITGKLIELPVVQVVRIFDDGTFERLCDFV